MPAHIPYVKAVKPRLSLSLILAVAAALVVTVLLQRLPAPGQEVARTPVVSAVLDDPGSPAAGSRYPHVTIVVFTDYQCGICKRTDPALERLLSRDATVQVIWKDWPIRGPASDFAARVALAAHRQGLYMPVHAAQMKATGELTPDRVLAIAAQAGADPTRLDADLTAHAREIDAQIGRHRLQAFSLGLQGTPAYLVGPYLIQGGLDDEALDTAVSRARRAGPPKSPAI